MRFYAVSTEAIELTHQALQKLDGARMGSGRASRALRVATLYGHLQCRARGGQPVWLSCRDLANAWHLQTRELRADLQDLEAIGWLSYTSSTKGLYIRLHEPQVAYGRGDQSADVVDPDECNPEPQAAEGKQAKARQTEQPIAAGPSEPSAQPESTPAQSPLIAQFAATYNQHKPQSWPAYNPTGSALASKLQKAIRHAGGAEAFWSVLIRALGRVPEFWRVTYPQGRSGSDCAMALLSADRKAAGLGVEFWHVFSWGSQGQTASGTATYNQLLNGGIGGNTPEVGSGVAPGTQESDLTKANRLLFWNRDHWHGRGIEAAKLDRREKQRLAELLEAQGEGTPGTAAEQFSQPARQH
jgi:hypothetical protein